MGINFCLDRANGHQPADGRLRDPEMPWRKFPHTWDVAWAGHAHYSLPQHLRGQPEQVKGEGCGPVSLFFIGLGRTRRPEDGDPGPLLFFRGHILSESWTQPDFFLIWNPKAYVSVRIGRALRG